MKKSLTLPSLQSNPSISRGNGFLAGRVPAGIVTVNAVAAARDVWLYSNYGTQLLRRSRSAADGSYNFIRLNETQSYLLMAKDDGDPPTYQPYAHDFAVPVVPVALLARTDMTARAIVQHQYLVGTKIRILHASPEAWNVNAVITAVGPGWLEFSCADTLPAVAGGDILIQRRYGA